ncbi:hypothetical protein [Culturomica massiliensis]|uniref:hypothetical protein n=1 Tax=Culturomica massiliensis TaxID=1841857 RepID=UPI00266686DC|nr:hypothetical protein [Culturomica massiliensis]
MNYTLIKTINGYNYLDQFGLAILQSTIANFLSCEVKIFTNPLSELQDYDINILDNENRGFYPLDDDNIIVLGRIMSDDKKLISSLGIKLSKKGIRYSGKFLTILEGALTYTLTQEYKNNFKNCKYSLGDELILHTVCNYVSRGGYDNRHIRHLISIFQKLRTTSFEGSFFSTGLILTKSHFAYNKNDRFGTSFNLRRPFSLANQCQIERRIWYLVDGKKTFFMCNKSLIVGQLFVLDKEYQNANYIDSHTLAKSLKGVDLLFKVENEKTFSIINTSNIEISYMENQWKFRDYTYIRKLFLAHFNNIDIVESLLFFVIHCSKNSISSIIWLPDNIDQIGELIKKQTMNRFIKTPISIMDKSFTNHIIRYLSSDGATIIDKNGLLQYFGCIIDLNKIEVKGIKGTGESAAGALSSNGISLKISQDGTIKLFNEKKKQPILI